jgi:hypothetical protein
MIILWVFRFVATISFVPLVITLGLHEPPGASAGAFLVLYVLLIKFIDCKLAGPK